MNNNNLLPTSDYPTNKDLNQALEKHSASFGKIISNILIEIDTRFNQQDTKFEAKFNKLSKDILDGNLQIIEELRISREEQSILNHRQSLHSNQLETQDNRISFLEKNCVVKLTS